MRLIPQPWRTVVFVVVAGILAAGPAHGADTGNGSKNFTTPRTVPNYFSNEPGPMLGAASETQRGALYMSQTYGSPRPAAAAAPAVQPEMPRQRQHVAMAEPRGRLIRIRGRSGRVVAHHVTVHGRALTRAIAHGSARGHTTYAAARTTHYAAARVTHSVAKSHAATHATHANTTRRHARG